MKVYNHKRGNNMGHNRTLLSKTYYKGEKIMKKSILAILLALVMVFSLAACGGADSAEGDVPVLKVGTEPTFPPFDTTDPETQEIVGFDMDLIAAIGADQGFDVEFVNLSFDGLIPALKNGDIDIVAAGMTITDERLEQVDFSKGYYDSQLVVAVAIDNETITGIDDLTADMKVAAQTGTTGALTTQDLADQGKIGEAVILDGLDTCMMQLINGDVDAVINDKPVTTAYINKQADKIKMVGDTLSSESYGFAVQKGNAELQEQINAGLANVIENGTFDELITKWFN